MKLTPRIVWSGWLFGTVCIVPIWVAGQDSDVSRVKPFPYPDAQTIPFAASPSSGLPQELLSRTVQIESPAIQTAQIPPGSAAPAATSGPATTVAAPPPFNEKSARSTAVALNYCRASFHRLRQNPSHRVWFEEQQHILNNLNLNEIADQEVITLYTAVLDEVSKERIAEKERRVLQDNYKHQVRRQALSTVFVMGAELTTAQYVNAVRTGANSWWDFRATGQTRELDLWKVEKTRLTEVSDKSNKFLNTFWDLAKKKQIPDEWLVRGNNLEDLEAALAEADPAVRLRVLKRMEPIMVCYPPYYYHLGRTQQAQGAWIAASDTYAKLVELGHGHFRADEMLAAGLANQALIQAHLKQPEATQTAQRALKYANGAWQVNLVCARILQQAGKAEDAEEAILRNVDVDLERPQSLATLMSLYVENGDEQKLVTALNDPANVADLPALSLLQTASRLGVKKMPAQAMRQLVTSLYVYERPSFGRSQLVCMAAPAWGLDSAQAVMVGQQPELPDARGLSSRGQTQLSFKSDGVVQYNTNGEPEIVMEISYLDGQPVKLHLKPQSWSQEMSDHVEGQTGRGNELRDLFPRLTQTRPRLSFIISEAEFGSTKVALWDRGGSTDPGNQPLFVDQKRLPGNAITQPHMTTKPAQVIIEGIKPLPPLTQELTRPVESKPSAEKASKSSASNETKSTPTSQKPHTSLFRPAQLPTRGRVQLSDELEEFDD